MVDYANTLEHINLNLFNILYNLNKHYDLYNILNKILFYDEGIIISCYDKIIKHFSNEIIKLIKKNIMNIFDNSKSNYYLNMIEYD